MSRGATVGEFSTRYEKDCARCGDAFVAKVPFALYCSKSCRNQAAPPCSRAGCGKPIRARGLCGTHYNQEYRPDRKKVTVPCTWCGSPCQKRADSGRARQYCSLRCRTSDQYSESRSRKLPVLRESFDRTLTLRWREAVARQAQEAPPVRPQHRHWKFIAVGPCAWCSQNFAAMATTILKLPRYCSTQCSRAAQRLRYGRFTIVPAKRLAIYERDRWICQLCGDPVDRDLPPSDPWAATLDHVECQAWVLVPDHSPENLRLAHRWCNSVRSDERFYSAEVLTV